MAKTMADKLRENMSKEETIVYNSLQFCSICKMATNHLISNCPKLEKKNAREIQKREQELESIKFKYGRNWYIQVEDTVYDCEEALNLRIEDERREEEQYWREEEDMEKEIQRKRTIENFLKELTPENAKERTEQLVNGELKFSSYNVHICSYLHDNYNLVLQHMSKQSIDDLYIRETDDSEYIGW